MGFMKIILWQFLVWSGIKVSPYFRRFFKGFKTIFRPSLAVVFFLLPHLPTRFPSSESSFSIFFLTRLIELWLTFNLPAIACCVKSVYSRSNFYLPFFGAQITGFLHDRNEFTAKSEQNMAKLWFQIGQDTVKGWFSWNPLWCHVFCDVIDDMLCNQCLFYPLTGSIKPVNHNLLTHVLIIA